MERDKGNGEEKDPSQISSHWVVFLGALRPGPLGRADAPIAEALACGAAKSRWGGPEIQGESARLHIDHGE